MTDRSHAQPESEMDSHRGARTRPERRHLNSSMHHQEILKDPFDSMNHTAKFASNKFEVTSTAQNSFRMINGAETTQDHSVTAAISSVKDSSMLNAGNLKAPNARTAAMPKSAQSRHRIRDQTKSIQSAAVSTVDATSMLTREVKEKLKVKNDRNQKLRGSVDVTKNTFDNTLGSQTYQELNMTSDLGLVIHATLAEGGGKAMRGHSLYETTNSADEAAERTVRLEKVLSDGTLEMIPVKDLGGWARPVGTQHTMDLELKEELDLPNKETLNLLKQQNEQDSEESIGSLVIHFYGMALPAIFGALVFQVQEITNLVTAGHLGDPVIMAGIGLGNMTVNLVAMVPLLCTTHAIKSLVPQAFGRGNLDLCGVFLNRARILVTIVFILSSILILQAKDVYRALKQDENAISYMDIYLMNYLPAVYLFTMGDLQRKFLNSLGKTNVPLLVQLVGSSLHPVWSYLFVFHLKYGLQGIGIAGTITNTTNLILLIFATSRFDDIKDAVFFPDDRSFYGLWEQAKISFPIMFAAILDWGTFETMVFTAGRLGVIEQAAQAMLMTIALAAYDVGSGFSDAVAPVLGTPIGQGRVNRAHRIYRVVQVSGFVGIILIGLGLHSGRNVILSALTNVGAVHKEAGKILDFIFWNTVPELYKGMMKGVIFVLLLQDQLAYIHMFSNWMLNLALQYYFVAKLDMGLVGIWLAKLIMEWTIITLQTILVESADWHEKARQIAAFQQGIEDEIKAKQAEDEQKLK